MNVIEANVQETFFIQIKQPTRDEWFSIGTSETQAGAFANLYHLKANEPDREFRVVRSLLVSTLTEVGA